jgi:hypothetical protein
MIKLTLLYGVFLLLGSSAYAGNDSGHGGGAFICQDSSQSEFLDIYEARRGAFGTPAGTIQASPLSIQDSADPVETQIQSAFARLKLSPPVYNLVLQTYQQVRMAKIIPLPPGEELAWPSDEKNRYIKAGCEAVGIMVFYDAENAMDQDTASLQSMPNTEQAAAWVHETLYKFFRATQNDTDSVRTRQVVGHLFSNESSDQVLSALNGLNLYMGATYTGFQPDGLYITDSVYDSQWGLSISYKITSTGGQCPSISEIDGTISNPELPSVLFGQNKFHLMLTGVLNQIPMTPACRWNVVLTDIYGHSVTGIYDQTVDYAMDFYSNQRISSPGNLQ